MNTQYKGKKVKLVSHEKVKTGFYLNPDLLPRLLSLPMLVVRNLLRTHLDATTQSSQSIKTRTLRTFLPPTYHQNRIHLTTTHNK